MRLAILASCLAIMLAGHSAEAVDSHTESDVEQLAAQGGGNSGEGRSFVCMDNWD